MYDLLVRVCVRVLAEDEFLFAQVWSQSIIENNLYELLLGNLGVVIGKMSHSHHIHYCRSHMNAGKYEKACQDWKCTPCDYLEVLQADAALAS